MNLLYFDTETASLPDFKKGAHESQPPIIQLAAQLYDWDAKRTVATYSTYVQPCIPYEMNPEAEAIHKISAEAVNQFGVSAKKAYQNFCWMLARADAVVAHNAKFDVMMLESHFHQLYSNGDDVEPINWSSIICTMQLATGLVPVYNKWGKPKWPKLGEAYKHFTGKELKDAHDALVDVYACRIIHQKLIENNHASLHLPS